MIRLNRREKRFLGTFAGVGTVDRSFLCFIYNRFTLQLYENILNEVLWELRRLISSVAEKKKRKVQLKFGPSGISQDFKSNKVNETWSEREIEKKFTVYSVSDCRSFWHSKVNFLAAFSLLNSNWEKLSILSFVFVRKKAFALIKIHNETRQLCWTFTSFFFVQRFCKFFYDNLFKKLNANFFLLHISAFCILISRLFSACIRNFFRSETWNEIYCKYNKTYEIFIYAEFLQSLHIYGPDDRYAKGWQRNANEQSPQNPTHPRTDHFSACRTEVRTINGFMLIAIRNLLTHEKMQRK